MGGTPRTEADCVLAFKLFGRGLARQAGRQAGRQAPGARRKEQAGWGGMIIHVVVVNAWLDNL